MVYKGGSIISVVNEEQGHAKHSQHLLILPNKGQWQIIDSSG